MEADAADCVDGDGRVEGREFLAEAFDDRVDVRAVAEVLVAPDRMVQALVGPDSAGFRHQAVQEVVLEPGQRHLAVLPANHPPVDVQPQLGDWFGHRLDLRRLVDDGQYGWCRSYRKYCVWRGRHVGQLQERAGLVRV